MSTRKLAYDRGTGANLLETGTRPDCGHRLQADLESLKGNTSSSRFRDGSNAISSDDDVLPKGATQRLAGNFAGEITRPDPGTK